MNKVSCKSANGQRVVKRRCVLGGFLPSVAKEHKMSKIQETKEYRIKKSGSTDRKARQQLQVKYIKDELCVKRAKKGKVDEDVYGQGCDLLKK